MKSCYLLICGLTFTKLMKQLLKSVRCVKLLLLNSKKWKKLKVVTVVNEHVIGVAKGCDDEMIKDLNTTSWANVLKLVCIWL